MSMTKEEAEKMVNDLVDAVRVYSVYRTPEFEQPMNERAQAIIQALTGGDDIVDGPTAEGLVNTMVALLEADKAMGNILPPSYAGWLATAMGLLNPAQETRKGG